MADTLAKDVILSYAPLDRTVAEALTHVLTDWFGQTVWLRDFALDGGQLVIDAMSQAVSEAKWFILLLSNAAIESGWVRTEANLATFKALQDDNFRILILRLEDGDLPKYLRLALRGQDVWDLTDPTPSIREQLFLKVAELIETTGPTHTDSVIYVDRGDDADRFTLLARRNKFIFVLGLPGIGKTNFCLESLPAKLHKRPLLVRITRGHSLDLLARDILQRAHMPQPATSIEDDEEALLSDAVDAVRLRSDRFFWILDNVEDGFDTNNGLQPYLETFLSRLISVGLSTHVILTTTRPPDLSPGIIPHSDILRLERIDDLFIREAIDLWLEGSPYRTRILQSESINGLVALASGHPLAAKLLAAHLKANKTPKQLVSAYNRKRFELRLASYLLRDADQDMPDLERLILHILASVSQPIPLEDMLSVSELAGNPIEDIHGAVWKLSNRYLIQQEGELLSLHRFLETHFRDQLLASPGRRDRIATEFGRYAYDKAIQFNGYLRSALSEGVPRSDERAATLSGSIFRYAVPAGRLLRSVGMDELAEHLPIRVKGTLREMVFYFYQDVREYRMALKYAESWLAIHPTDAEIKLFQARCYRNFRDADGLRRAEQILTEIEEVPLNWHFRARVARERALIAEARGDTVSAEYHFREGVKYSPKGYYPENHIGLAQLLMKKSESVANDSEAHRMVNEAVELLECAREHNSLFDHLHIGLYIGALIDSDRADEAYPLLVEALEDNPEDPRLNYRLAELLRRKGAFGEAERRARIALAKGLNRAVLTIANSIVGEVLQRGESEVELNVERLDNALRVLDQFQPEYGTDLEVVDGIRAKIYRVRGEWDLAASAIEKYESTVNPFTIYEQSRVGLWRAAVAKQNGEWDDLETLLNKVVRRLDRLKRVQSLSGPLDELRASALEMKAELVLRTRTRQSER
jgi:tetratricopeptide (TPR) repeat protein